jgi:hypothetical protein
MTLINKAKHYSVLGLLLAGLIGAQPGLAEPGVKPTPLNDPTLETLLHQQIDPEERVQLQSLIKAELEPSLPGEERVVLWTSLGPTYWSNHLGVLSQQNGQWKSLATLSLAGAEATLEAVTSDGLISVNAKTPGPNDPVCCPSQQKTLHFRYAKGQLVEAGTVGLGRKP